MPPEVEGDHGYVFMPLSLIMWAGAIGLWWVSFMTGHHCELSVHDWVKVDIINAAVSWKGSSALNLGTIVSGCRDCTGCLRNVLPGPWRKSERV